MVAVNASAEKPTGKEADFKEAAVWVEAHRADVPACVYDAVMLLCSLRAELERTRQRAANLLILFRRELGIIPKSERGSAPPSDNPTQAPKTDEQRLAELKARRAKLLLEIRRYEDRLGKGRKKRQKTSKGGNSKSVTSAPASQSVPEPPEPAFERSGENLFSGNLAQPLEEQQRIAVNKMENFENPRGLHSSDDDRTRHEYGVTTKTIHLKVETLTDPRTGKSVTASTDEIGPPNSQATWTAIANTITSVIGYAIPINRLATMLKESNPYFTSSRLCFHLKYSAELFAPIYTCLGEDLSDCDVLQGDDTKARVIEVNKALKDGGTLKEATEDSLIGRVADVFGRVFNRKNGKGTKRSFNVSAVIGKSRSNDPRSYIFFFRSHLGTFGDLVTRILELRNPKKRDVTIISDMATTNLVSPALYKKFNIIHAGCAAHARRPFWRHKDKDQRLCYWMLSAFLVLEQIEDRIDELGRTKARILRYRQRYSRKVWAAILKRCQAVLRGETVYGHFWPKTSKIHIACRYIVKHYPELTAYLDDPRLPSNNNLSERVLRWDKIMEDASKFRATEAGRLHVDILRTIVHTCSAAGVELRDYLLFVFKNRDAIAADPRQFTPYAYALILDARIQA